MPHVNQLIDKFGKKGFAVVFVTDGPDGDTKKFVEETQLKAVVAWEKPLKTMEDFGFDGYPSGALIAPNGKIVWTGHPSGLTEKLIEENLTGVTLAPPSDKLSIDCELPKKYAPTAKMLATGKLAEGRKALATALSAKDLKDDDKAPLEAAQAEVDKLLDDELGNAQKAHDDKRYFDAQTTWKRLSTQARGLDAAKTADQKLTELAKDASLKKELEAGARIAEAQKLAAAGKTKPAIAALTALGESYLKDTEEAKRGKALAEQLKEELKKS